MRATNCKKIACNTFIFTFTLAMAFTPVFASAGDGERTITLQEDVTKTELIRLNVPAGDVEIVGATGNSLTAVATAACQKEDQESCQQVLKEFGWSKKIGKFTQLDLSPSGVTRYENMSIKVKLGVPSDKKLEVNLSAGELRIDGTNACLIAEVNAGDINITLRESQVASIELTAKVGDARLVTSKGAIEGDRSMLVGSSLVWGKGTGTCHTKANVLAGAAKVTLK